MRVFALRRLREFWEGPPVRSDAEQPLRAWYREAEMADWKTPADIKEKYRSASFVGGNRVVFNIAGNKYRLVVHVNYPARTVFVRFVGTHKDYDAIRNIETI